MKTNFIVTFKETGRWKQFISFNQINETAKYFIQLYANNHVPS